ncbi:hypothetical protein [uncultured Pseudomonas sp.]|uniref:hypothetical protein n=1 Tax=uncultured Pseudomonas sp. TaxID=114707 RepID=UPI0025896547|nr:hypothetical protein [uncultured Pseudomonas sp.]
MPVKILKIVDSNDKELENGANNKGTVPPLTIYGKATANHMIVLWFNKELQDVHPTSTAEGNWTYKFTPKPGDLDIVAAEVNYHSADNGTFKTI